MRKQGVNRYMHPLIRGLQAAVHLPRFTVLLAFLISVPTAHSAEFCAVSVKIMTAAGVAPISSWVELIDQSGAIELRKEVKGATFTICDFEFGPHTLRVGINECLPVSISNLRVVLGSPLHLDVILNACEDPDVMRDACLLYLRAVDAQGRPVSGAEIVIGTT